MIMTCFVKAIDGEWECACDYYRNGSVIFVPMRLRGARGGRNSLRDPKIDMGAPLKEQFSERNILSCGSQFSISLKYNQTTEIY